MAPCVRHVYPNTQVNQNSIVHEPLTNTSTNNNLQGPRKRTFVTTDPIASALPVADGATAPPNKKARNTSPSHGRPMQLQSMGERSTETEQEKCTAIDSTLGKGKTTLLLFAPAPHMTPIPMPLYSQDLDPALTGRENDDTDSDDSIETEREWIDQLTEPTQGFPPHVSEAMAIERPLWISSITPAAAPGGVSVAAPGSVSVAATGSASVAVPFFELGLPPLLADSASVATPGSASIAVPFAGLGYPPLQFAGGGDAADASLDPYHGIPQGTWSSKTDLIFLAGTTRLMLMSQHPSVRTIIHNSFENMQVYLLLVNSFPDAVVLPAVLKDCLFSAAAESQNPLAPDIHQQLHQDTLYMGKLCPLPRAHIPIYRAEIKERCVALVRADFLAVRSAPTIVEAVAQQLGRYTYTFPMGLNNDPIHVLPMRTRPYRNICIIGVIRDLYFMGGNNSFAHWYRARFPTFENEQGVVQEVPPVMVAVVATALYAAIHKWHIGSHNPAEFSMNTYLDVYNGHIQTLNHISQNQNGAFHRMMADIYQHASEEVEVVTTLGVPIVNIDPDQLDD